jgi:hypothetical protein
MRRHTLQLVAACAASVVLGVASFACAIAKNDPVFAFLGFATLLPLGSGIRRLMRLSRGNRT